MITYHVRSRSLVDIYNDLKEGKLILSPYFQRKLVWRLSHKIDFIKTILLGFPFPEIFISRGSIDLEKMTSIAGVVDGQQRLNSIREFIEGVFEVDGRKYSQLPPEERERFLKYEIAVIDLDLASEDPKIKDIFQRLNRTFYALSTIEKMATEFASVDYMLVAKLLAGDFLGDTEEKAMLFNIENDRPQVDPNLTNEFVSWANHLSVDKFHKFILNSSIFTAYELSRQVHLMYTLNIMSTCINGYYNRNDKTKSMLESVVNPDDWEDRDQLVDKMERSAKLIVRVKPMPTAFWSTKSNSFTLFVEVYKNLDLLEGFKPTDIKSRLKDFANNVDPEYRQAAKEGVNNLRERVLRGRFLSEVLLG